MLSNSFPNILTVDLEDYFMVSAFESVVKRGDWDRYESRIERNTYRLLDILSSSLCSMRYAPCSPPRATFFCLGWVAERYPELIKEIHRLGHEIASHGYDHRIIATQSPRLFREDIRKSKALLEDLIGKRVIGYRAPSYSITRETLWSLEILAEEGYQYDSSIFPIHHDRYGIPNAPRFPFIISSNGNGRVDFQPLSNNSTNSIKSMNSSNPSNPIASNLGRPACRSLGVGRSDPQTSNFLIEFPLTTLRILGHNLPVAGGGYFRLLPFKITKMAFRRIWREDVFPLVFYIHPWELDEDQPRVQGLSLKSRFRHYVNLKKTEERFRKLLTDFRFSAAREVIEQYWMTAEQ